MRLVFLYVVPPASRAARNPLATELDVDAVDPSLQHQQRVFAPRVSTSRHPVEEGTNY